jgi:enoyl-CoA hydratase/carnithine racemase
MTATVLTHESNGVLTLTINRPERRNALDVATYLALAEQIRAASANKASRAIILTGANQYFTAGNDLKDFQKPRASGDSGGLTLLRSLIDCDLPIIAAVEGRAIGIGVTMLQHCDFICAADNALFTIPFVALGLCPEGASSVLLAQIVGARRASDWLLRGKTFGAQEAYESGFITQITNQGQALAIAQALGDELAALPAEALQLSKRMMKHAQRPMLHQTLDYEFGLFSERLHSAEAQAAVAKLLKK